MVLTVSMKLHWKSLKSLTATNLTCFAVWGGSGCLEEEKKGMPNSFGRQLNSLERYGINSLRAKLQALAMSPDNGNVKFNIAYDQFQLADVLRETDPSKRTVEDIEKAAADLETAIEYFSLEDSLMQLTHRIG